MSSFPETLANFQAYILGNNDQIKIDIVGDSDEAKQLGLQVYRNGYSLRLLEALAKDYPMLSKLAGNKRFEKIGRDYINAYSSNHYSIRYFGQQFNKFLLTHPQAKPGYAELAFFELMLEEVALAPDADYLTFDNMAAVPPEAWAKLQLLVHPSLQTTLFFYNAPAIWQAVHDDSQLPAIKFSEIPETWLIWRFNRQVHFCPATTEQAWMLQAFQAGKVFAEVCEGLCEWLNEETVTQFAAETLRNWIVEGIFSGYKII